MNRMTTSPTMNRISAYGKAALKVASETLWPTRCACCDAPGQLLCDTCASTLPFIDVYQACPHCGAAFGRIQCCECNPVTLTKHKRDKIPYDHMASATILNDNSRHLITVYKDAGELRLANIISAMMVRYIPPQWQSSPVTFIPASAVALRRRGFDHAELLAMRIAALLGEKSYATLARPHARDQRKLTRQSRISNLENSFEMDKRAFVPKKLIVVDDVCTTGATLYAAADALRSAGAQELFGLTFARA